jgi:hypothetical protein
MGSLERRLERLEALYGDGEPAIPQVVLDRAFARVCEKAMDHIYDALVVRDAFGGATHINLVELPYKLLKPEEVEALEHLREALEEAPSPVP